MSVSAPGLLAAAVLLGHVLAVSATNPCPSGQFVKGFRVSGDLAVACGGRQYANAVFVNSGQIRHGRPVYEYRSLNGFEYRLFFCGLQWHSDGTWMLGQSLQLPCNGWAYTSGNHDYPATSGWQESCGPAGRWIASPMTVTAVCSTCGECASGQVRSGCGGSSAGSCIKTCPPGRTGPDGGNCTLCAAGFFKNSWGDLSTLQACTKCEAGKYAAASGATSCTDCTASIGLFCPAGSLSAAGDECPAGWYCAGGSRDKEPCRARIGRYCPAGWGFPTGLPCPEGYVCKGGSMDKQKVKASAADTTATTLNTTAATATEPEGSSIPKILHMLAMIGGVVGGGWVIGAVIVLVSLTLSCGAVCLVGRTYKRARHDGSVPHPWLSSNGDNGDGPNLLRVVADDAHGRPMMRSGMAFSPSNPRDAINEAEAGHVPHESVRVDIHLPDEDPSPDVALARDAICCPACEEPYKTAEPRTPCILPCFHTYCRLCLESWAMQGSAQIGGFCCPTCRVVCPTAVEALPLNYALVEVIEAE